MRPQAVASVFFLLALIFAAPGPLAAQQTGWIQVEAHPDIATARARAALFSGRFDSVRGFRLDTGWYAIAIGPLDARQAEAEARRLRRSGLIPRDAYYTDGQEYRDAFWTDEADAPAASAAPGRPGDRLAQTEPEAVAPPVPAEETLAEARRSEAALDAEERRQIQRALAWFGHYRAGIDGAFGGGTRAAMAAWQQAQGLEPTGVLTTGQRARLEATYSSERDRLGLERYVDDAAGIELTMPLGLLRFDRHDPPFAHFEPGTDDGVRALLISMPGDAAALAGLYEAMQSLEIVPQEGGRSLGRDAFSIAGSDDRIASQFHAWLRDGAIKGFGLVWPRRLDETMARVLPTMRESFRSTGPSVLDDRLDRPTGAFAGVDLIAGLETRQPQHSRSGVFIDARGTALTAHEAVAGCGRVTLDGDIEAEVVLADPELGIAVLRPRGPVAPRAHARFAEAAPNGNSEIAVAGYSYGGSLGGPTLTWGQVSATGQDAAAAGYALMVQAEDGDTGGPILDMAGTVVGVLLGEQDGTRQLPPGVRRAAGPGPLTATLRAAGLEVRQAPVSGAMAPEDLAVAAGEMTVLVSCWD